MKIAVIGSGISGLGAALALSDTADVTVFEKDQRVGGHANTATIDYDGVEIPVDTGFIVFNDKNYPNLCSLFDYLDVPSEESDMSFSMRLDGGKLEYACNTLDTVFAQRWRMFDPRTLRALSEALRFNKEATAALRDGSLDGLTLDQFLTERRFQRYFRNRFLYPMGGAIWSTPSADIGDFPARAFVQFFVNHELLNGFRRVITWRTVSGGSQSYIRKVLQKLGPRVRLGVGATAVERRENGKVRVAFDDGSEGMFDHVILATHSDQAAAVLQNGPARDVVSQVRYKDNTAVLHRDPRLMPQRRKVWASWNFEGRSGAEHQAASLTYWMNKLQNIPNERPLFVTLNPLIEPREDLVFGRYSYAHPQYDTAAFDAQDAIDAHQGRDGVWFAGAWLGWGFHEDGLKSGLRVAQALGARPVWAADRGAPIGPLQAIAAE